MAGILNIGDVLMLSQLAWKIGRAFTAGRKGAPAEFVEVEAEVNGLAKALKLLAETLFTDNASSDSGNEGGGGGRDSDASNGNGSGSILARASAETRNGVEVILTSCQTTLKDLESLLEQYQVIRKHRTSGGFSIERSWSDLVLSSYKKMLWTTEGGNIQALRNMLHMHTSTISLTMKALQSKSLARLEETVHPMAEKVDEIHSAVTGDLSDKIQDVHAIVMAIAGASPRLNPRDSRAYDLPLWDSPLLEPMPERSSGAFSTAARTPALPSSPGSTRRPSTNRTWRKDEGADLPTVRDEIEVEDQQPVSPRSPPRQQQQRTDSRLSFSSPMLPSPAIPPDPDSEVGLRKLSLGSVATMDTEKIPLERLAAAKSQLDTFEKEAFKDSAILCELHGKQVEYLQPPKDENFPLDVEMGDAMGACRILVVRKRDLRPGGSIRLVTSIWSLSDDGLVRMQQKLADGVEVIPHASYFVPEKISLPLVTELKFHDKVYGSKPIKVEKTSWCNYVFEDVKSATLFQNELMGRTLVGVFKTEKTLRVHEGLSGVLAYQEQMCGMENLRLWADPDNGGVLAMIHFSAHFRAGYLAFYLNSSACPVRVKDEGGKEVKIKGLKIPLDRDKAGIGGRRGSESGKAEGKKYIAGAKVEFASDVEKFLFLEKVKEVQQTMILLPEV
ncbi:hypothetical protein B0J12DRAFT_573240 [Macrophomina phaseolina]|uniref:Fungal N-terminal domain-containing protein n=1 Tax=Macrophomina phaseolina TaxID=35725 RepID=A0ABQ8GBY9_9PEZI|nr:hypothetical protein B0J12DRAFT_573240 [Macrophomina phaseolina]